MSVYQCLRCGNFHGWHPVFKFKEIDQKRNQRYDDCNIYHCPYCDVIMDTRDITPFFGCRGQGTLREIKGKAIRELAELYEKLPSEEKGDANVFLHKFVPIHNEDYHIFGYPGMGLFGFGEDDDDSDDE